jgi:hypothetical protein
MLDQTTATKQTAARCLLLHTAMLCLCREISEQFARAREEGRNHANTAAELRKAIIDLRRQSEAEVSYYCHYYC